MKYLLIFILLVVLFLLLYRRLRPHLIVLQQLLNLAREVRRVSASQSSGPIRRAGSESADKLVRCASCSTWIPESRAFSAGASAACYCSQSCLNTARESLGPKRMRSR